MITEKKTYDFVGNPNDLPEAGQYKGDIYIKFAGHSCMTVYGITEAQVMDMVNKFKLIEPKTGVVEIYGPADEKGHRDYINTIVMY